MLVRDQLDASSPTDSRRMPRSGQYLGLLIESNKSFYLSQEKVLLVEAGPKDTILGSKFLQWKIHMPAALTYNLCDDKYNWYYHTLPQKHVNNRVMYWPRGRVWGGSSSLNAMAYVRGHAEDYNRWEREGAGGWSYEAVLPYFRKAQTHSEGGDEYRGGAGPLHVTHYSGQGPLDQAWLQAGQQAGIVIVRVLFSCRFCTAE